jgi:hypothetical protein
MSCVLPSTVHAAAYELYFPSLSLSCHALSFPCDERGQVRLDALSERARNNYLYARALMGHDYGLPTVMAAAIRH